GIRVGAVYVGWTTDGNTVSYNIPIESVLDQLRGTGAVVMIHAHMTKDAKVSDQRIAGQLVTLAKQAEAAGVSIALYPHVGNRVATLEQAARIADMVDHPSLGVCFNLCHYLRQNRAEDLPAKLRAAKGRIKLVTISGADKGNTRVMNWKQLIRPIDQGQFDLPGLLELLCVDLEYQGPIFIQCYNLKAPARSILQDAFDRWQVLKKHCHPQDPSKLEAGKK
ncbi:MAG: TIM barrel protein, partial [Pirellulales bacterium]|nr:TIM barrel protein [Pirellulales bacterium]